MSPKGVRRQHQVGVQGYRGLLCPSHADTAFTFRPLCSQWRAQLWRRLWLPGPLTPVPVATVTRPSAANLCVIHLAAVRAEKWNTPSSARPLGIDRNASTDHLRMGRDYAGAAPLPFLTVIAGAAGAKFRSRHYRSGASAWRSAERHSRRRKQPGPTGGPSRRSALFRRPVVGQFPGGYTPPILQWQSS